MREPYPLQWPSGFSRTEASKRLDSRFGKGMFKIGLATARNDVLAEMDRLGAANYIITTDLPTRRDGLPYADGRANDPGVAVWFVLADQERVFACDKWKTHAENMRAIALSVEAMRGLERWGMADVVARAFSGFNALPPGAPIIPKRSWREVLGLNGISGLEPAIQLATARVRHRELIKDAHPDAGGDHERAAELNAAIAEAKAELGG